MLATRPIRFSVFLIALAVAGCASTGNQAPQIFAAGDRSRPKTVLIYDFVFSPDVAVADREFTTRLAREIGDISVSNQIVAKRVNAEIVATIITILRDEAGLNARSGNEDDAAYKDTTLIVSGQLRAADRGPRSNRMPANFVGGVIADIDVSRFADGTKTQLFTFAAAAQKGVAFTGPAAAVHNTAIKTLLATQSVPTESLSPDVESQARRLGRAIADRINAYALQQGWINKADLPERRLETKPARDEPNELPDATMKQSGLASTSDEIPCNAFVKNERGHWYVKGPVTIKIGSAENKTLQDLEIVPKFYTIGGVDLYETVQKKCGNNQRPLATQQQR
jgi:hypothetical protein